MAKGNQIKALRLNSYLIRITLNLVTEMDQKNYKFWKSFSLSKVGDNSTMLTA